MSQTVIVLEEDCILASWGKEGKHPSILRAKEQRLRGRGDVFERWQKGLEELGQEWRQGPVTLVLPASLCSTRVLTLPYGKKAVFTAMAQKELEDSFRNEAADYSVLFQEKRGSIDICAGGVEAKNLERLLGICEKAGFSVGSMTVPMEGYLHMLMQLESYWTRTAIYLLFEEESMVSVLCREGRYVYSSRSRIFSEPGTLDFGTEIVRSISGILQFSGNKQNLNITEVYYAGCGADDFEVGLQGIQNMHLLVFPIEMEKLASLPAGHDVQDWLPCIGAFTRPGKKEKRMNLRLALKVLKEQENERDSLWKHLMVPGLTLGACLAAAAVTLVLNIQAQRNIDKQQAWLEQPKIQEQYNRYLDLKGQVEELKETETDLIDMKENLAGYPKLSSAMLSRMERIGGAEMEIYITGYDSETGVLTFDAGSNKVIDIPDYIQRLQETGLFSNVDYTGYTFENDWYTLYLSGTLLGTAKEQEEGGVQ